MTAGIGSSTPVAQKDKQLRKCVCDLFLSVKGNTVKVERFCCVIELMIQLATTAQSRAQIH